MNSKDKFTLTDKHRWIYHISFTLTFHNLKFDLLHLFLQANGLAAVGKFSGGLAGTAGSDSLFVAQHAY